MKNTLLTVVLWAGISSCTTSGDMTPAESIVGQWTLNRVAYTGFNKPFDSYNRVDSLPTKIGTGSFIFNSNHTYSETYAGYDYYTIDSLVTDNESATGTWGLTDTKPVQTLTFRPATAGTYQTEFDGKELTMIYTNSFYLSDELFHKYFADIPGYPRPVAYTKKVIYRKIR